MKKTALLVMLLTAVMLGACVKAPELPPTPAITVSLPVYSETTEEIWTAKDHAGKPMLVAVMATWCPWCKRSLPALDATSAAYGDQVEVVGIFIDEDPELVKKVIADHGMKTKALYKGRQAAEELGASGFPHIVLFDKKHRVVRSWSGYSDTLADQYKQEIDKLLK